MDRVRCLVASERSVAPGCLPGHLRPNPLSGRTSRSRGPNGPERVGSPREPVQGGPALGLSCPPTAPVSIRAASLGSWAVGRGVGALRQAPCSRPPPLGRRSRSRACGRPTAQERSAGCGRRTLRHRTRAPFRPLPHSPPPSGPGSGPLAASGPDFPKFLPRPGSRRRKRDHATIRWPRRGMRGKAKVLNRAWEALLERGMSQNRNSAYTGGCSQDPPVEVERMRCVEEPIS